MIKTETIREIRENLDMLDGVIAASLQDGVLVAVAKHQGTLIKACLMEGLSSIRKNELGVWEMRDSDTDELVATVWPNHGDSVATMATVRGS